MSFQIVTTGQFGLGLANIKCMATISFKLLLLFLAPLSGWASDHYGYVTDVNEERYSRNVEIHLVSPPPPPADRAPWVIFDDELSREFQLRYEERFGRSDVERNVINPSRFDEYEYSAGLSVSIEEDQKRKRVFGEFMMKRLTEHHLDQYAKSRPAFQSVYELKEKISNATVEVRQGYKARLRYSYSGNYVLLRLENPYNVRTAVTLEMDPSTFGPSEVQETILSLGYALNSKTDFDSYFRINSGDYSLVTSRRISDALSTSFTVASYSAQVDRPEPEDLILIGLTWNQ